MLGEDVFVAEQFFPQQSHLSEWVGDMQMNQVRIEETLFDVAEAILVYPQHLQLAQGIDPWRSDVNLHMSMARSRNLLDLERLRHVLAVADRENDRMAILGQCVNHADAEVAQGRVIRGGKPTQQVQDIHIVIIP